jgi:hypothetical protein
MIDPSRQPSASVGVEAGFEGRPSETAQIKAVSQGDAATMLNVSRSAVQQAKQVHDKAEPELAEC